MNNTSRFCLGALLLVSSAAVITGAQNQPPVNDGRLNAALLKATIGDVLYHDKAVMIGKKTVPNEPARFSLLTMDSRTAIALYVDDNGKATQLSYNVGSPEGDPSVHYWSDLDGNGTFDRLMSGNTAKGISLAVEVDGKWVPVKGAANGVAETTDGTNRRLRFDPSKGVWTG